jgi:hypothetical protein
MLSDECASSPGTTAVDIIREIGNDRMAFSVKFVLPTYDAPDATSWRSTGRAKEAVVQ